MNYPITVLITPIFLVLFVGAMVGMYITKDREKLKRITPQELVDAIMLALFRTNKIKIIIDFDIMNHFNVDFIFLKKGIKYYIKVFPYQNIFIPTSFFANIIDFRQKLDRLLPVQEAENQRIIVITSAESQEDLDRHVEHYLCKGKAKFISVTTLKSEYLPKDEKVGIDKLYDYLESL